MPGKSRRFFYDRKKYSSFVVLFEKAFKYYAPFEMAFRFYGYFAERAFRFRAGYRIRKG